MVNGVEATQDSSTPQRPSHWPKAEVVSGDQFVTLEQARRELDLATVEWVRNLGRAGHPREIGVTRQSVDNGFRSLVSRTHCPKR
jgi:hypothetical protein